MNELKLFENEEFGKVRTIVENEKVWFVAKDICDVLEIVWNGMVAISNVPEQWKGVRQFLTPGGTQELAVLSEQGLYFFLARSNKKKALPFQMWLAGEVLPSIRKHGGYIKNQENLSDDELMARAMEVAQRKIAEKNKLIEEQASKIQKDTPKVLFADSVSASSTSILVGELAKLLNQNGVKTGQKRLFAWLRENGYLMKNTSSFNLPTQKAMELGLFEIKETTVINPDNSVRINKTTKVTGKGQLYFVNKFLGGLQNAS